MNMKRSMRHLVFSQGHQHLEQSDDCWALDRTGIGSSWQDVLLKMHFFWQEKQPHFILGSETIKTLVGGTEKKKQQKKKTKRNDSYIGAKHSKRNRWTFFSAFVFLVQFFPLNLTAGGWGTTEKYLTTEICWSETNLSWLPPGRSPGYTFEIGPEQRHTCKHTVAKRHLVPKGKKNKKNYLLGSANVHYSKWRIKPWQRGNILISKCSRPLLMHSSKTESISHT